MNIVKYGLQSLKDIIEGSFLKYYKMWENTEKNVVK
jgi:hypothetical protein